MKTCPWLSRQSLRCLVTWKRKMLHDVRRHDVIAGHHIFIDLWGLEFCIWLRPRTVHVMRPRYEIINSLRSRPSAARFARIIYLFIFLIEAKTSFSGI